MSFYGCFDSFFYHENSSRFEFGAHAYRKSVFDITLSLSPTSSSVSSCEVSALDHEVLDDSVELRPFVAVTFLQRHTGNLRSA